MTRARRFTVLGVVALIALQFLWHAWLVPVKDPAWLAATLSALPMAAALLVFVARRPGAAIGAGMIALLYFAHGIMEAWADRSVWPLGLAEAGLATWVVVCSSWDGIRARIDARRKAAAPPV